MPAQYPNIEYNEFFGFRIDDQLYQEVLKAKKYWIPTEKKRYLSVAYTVTPECCKPSTQLKLFTK